MWTSMSTEFEYGIKVKIEEIEEIEERHSGQQK